MDLLSLYSLFKSQFGFQNWWPGESPFEITTGAILTQNTNWANVEKSLSNLKASGITDVSSLILMSTEDLVECIRPSGFQTHKAPCLRETSRLIEQGRIPMDGNNTESTQILRKRLLAVKGIGPETADSILLYACNRLSFVVDAYTRRVLSRVGEVDKSISYSDLQSFITDRIPGDISLYKDYHAQFVMMAKVFCRMNPNCEVCFMQKTCLHSVSRNRS